VIKGQATEVIDVGPLPPDGVLPTGSAARRCGPRRPRNRLLLVDDSAFFRNMLAPVLKGGGATGCGCAQRAGGPGGAALGPAVRLVLTDIEMPDMNGFEFAETIRADAHLSTMPIIALSSMVSPAAIERGPAGRLSTTMSPSSIVPA